MRLGVALLVLIAVAGPALSRDPYVVHLMILGSLAAILAVGLNVALGFAGLFSFAQGAFYGIGAYVSALLVLGGTVGFWPAFVLAGVAAGLAGFVLGLFTIRLGGHYLAIATFAFQEIVALIIRNWDSVTKGTAGITGVPGPPPLAIPGLPAVTFASELAYYYLVLAVLVAGGGGDVAHAAARSSASSCWPSARTRRRRARSACARCGSRSSRSPSARPVRAWPAASSPTT